MMAIMLLLWWQSWTRRIGTSGLSALALTACFPEIPPLEQAPIRDAAVEQEASDAEAASDAPVEAVEQDVGNEGPTCAPDWADCNGTQTDGCEVDTSDNPSHCGRCFHDCLGGICYEGSCLPALISDDSPNPFALALTNLDGTGDVYWTCDNGQQWLWTASSDLSEVKMLVGAAPDAGYGRATGIALGALDVFFVEYWRSAIWAVPKGGGTLRLVATDTPNGAWDLTVDTTYAYWVNRADGVLRRIELTANNGTPQTIVSGQATPIALTLGPDALFWGDETLLRISRSGLDGANPCVVVDTQYPPADLIWEDGWLYWREGNRGEPIQGRVAKAPDSCGATVEVLADGQGDPRTMALDDKHVYFNVLMAGAVRRVLKAGGPVEDFYVSSDDTHGIAVDKRAVYWSSWETGKVFRLAK